MRKRMFLATLLCLQATVARAGGFLNYEHGAVATGMADARTALADDASALFFNPAAITELAGLQLELGTTATLPTVHYQAARRPDPARTYTRFATGEVVQVNDGLNDADSVLKGYFPPHLYVCYRFQRLPLALGYGLNSPFGLGLNWPGNWDGRFITTESEMATFFNQPAAAVDLAELLRLPAGLELSLAAGYSFVYATAVMAQAIDLRLAEMFPLPEPVLGPEGHMKLKGSAIGHGWNLALWSRFFGKVAFGLSLRSGLSLPFSGRARFSFNADGKKALDFLGLRIPESTTGRVTIDLPWNMNLGLAWLGTERLKLALDLYLAFFQSYDELRMQFDCLGDNPPCDLGTDPIVTDWHTAWQLSLGAEYQATDRLFLRAGYASSFSPVPARTLEPSVPDGRQNNISLGAGFRGDWWKVDVGYMLAFWEVTKDNDVGGSDASGNPLGKANGLYQTVAHMLALSLSAWF